jgi:hypothetical protein
MRGYSVGITDERKHAIGLASSGMILISSFMKIGTGIQEILRYCLGNLRGCNVGNTDGKGL